MDKLKKTMGTLAAIAVIAGSAVGVDDTFTKKIHLKSTNKMYSNFEYRQERKNIGDKASADNLDYNGLRLFVEILNIEKDKCDGKMYPVNNKQSIRDQVKNFDKYKCPK